MPAPSCRGLTDLRQNPLTQEGSGMPALPIGRTGDQRTCSFPQTPNPRRPGDGSHRLHEVKSRKHSRETPHHERIKSLSPPQASGGGGGGRRRKRRRRRRRRRGVGGVTGLVRPGPRRRQEFTPEERKDASYWAKRQKNNESARRSRARRQASDVGLQRHLQALGEENTRLRAELLTLRHRFGLLAPHPHHALRLALPPRPPPHAPPPHPGAFWGARPGGEDPPPPLSTRPSAPPPRRCTPPPPWGGSSSTCEPRTLSWPLPPTRPGPASPPQPHPLTPARKARSKEESEGRPEPVPSRSTLSHTLRLKARGARGRPQPPLGRDPPWLYVSD
ncbi:hypothetical protein AAFF_G00299650 [Aldrovandia affinis]|uniref:BZIP domain-containing protein n=1 Tax=Aldrovandia affinis TaxID=143900 RepID=A0AAD7W180_9TELE|nr:hypothetical protein AAFF_G00299650 [Aldrovandia affinis]